MKVLVIGKGGREHALVWKLAQSPRAERVYCAPGNAGTAEDGVNVPIEANDLEALLHDYFCSQDTIEPARNEGNCLFPCHASSLCLRKNAVL